MQICCWPEMPPLPLPGEPVLVRAAVKAARPAARDKARAVLRAVLAAWSGVQPAEIALVEAGRGPVWEGRLDGICVAVSLAYGAGEAWIGLRRGGRIGVDVMRAEAFAEMQSVAHNYLGPVAAGVIAQAADPACAFAAAWTKYEAQLKCAGRGLTEWAGADAAPAAGVIELAGEGWAGAVAVAPFDPGSDQAAGLTADYAEGAGGT